MGLFFPATAAENCACYLTFCSQWMQASFHSCTGPFKRYQSCPTISGVSLTMKKNDGAIFSCHRGGKLRLLPHILLAMDAGDLPRLYRVLQTLPKLSHYLRCVFDYEKNDGAIFSCHRGGKLRLRPHILLAMDTGDLPRLYRVLSSLSNLSYYLR